MRKPARLPVTEIDELSAEMASLRSSYDLAIGEMTRDVVRLALLMEENEENPVPHNECRLAKATEIACRIQECARTLSSQAFKHCTDSGKLAKLLRVKTKKEDEQPDLTGPVF